MCSPWGLRPAMRRAARAAAILLLVLIPLARAANDYPSGRSTFAEQAFDMGDPVSASTGALHFEEPLLRLGGPAGLSFVLRYRSDLTRATWRYGPGLPDGFWWSPLETMEFDDDDMQLGAFATIQLLDGNLVSFRKDAGQWVPAGPGDFGHADDAQPVRFALRETAGGFQLLDPRSHRVHFFDKLPAPQDTYGRVSRIADRSGHALTYTYAGPGDLNPSRIADGLGRALDFTWEDVDGWTALTRVTDDTGRSVAFTHEAAGADNGDDWTLRSLTDAAGRTSTFRYTTVVVGFEVRNLVARIEDASGKSRFTHTYANRTLGGRAAARVVEQRDAFGNLTTFTYDTAAHVVTETRPDGTTVVYEQHGAAGVPKTLTDADGHTTTCVRDAATNQVTSVTDRLGDATSVTYHSVTGAVASVTDALGRTTTFTYAAQDQAFTDPGSGAQATFTLHDLVRVDHPDGTHDALTRDARGNVTSATDRAGGVTTFALDAAGRVLSRTNPSGGVIRHTYNADGTVATRTEDETGTTTFGYDARRRMDRITDPAGGVVRFTYDDADRLTAVTDPRGNESRFVFDGEGRLAEFRDPLGRTSTFVTDDLGRQTSVTDRRGAVHACTFAAGGTLLSRTDPNGVRIDYGLDRQGRRESMTIGGATWRWTLDAEDVATAFTTPLGRVTAFETNDTGALTALVDPLGNRTEFGLDARQRVVSATDALGRQTAFARDAHGGLVGVTEPVVGSTTCARNEIGAPTRITDPRGSRWDLAWSPLGRPTGVTDPLGRSWTQSWNSRGLAHETTLPGGGTVTRTYDPAGNLVSKAFPGGLTLAYTFDPDRNRVAGADGISLTRDAVGHVVATADARGAVSAATWDPGGRLATVTYDGGDFEVQYSYDATTGLLSRVRDTRTGSEMTFTYDADRRPASVTRSNGVGTAWTFDDADRITRIVHGDVGEVAYAFDAAGQVTSMTAALPLDPTVVLPVPMESAAFDAACQVTGPGWTYDALGRRTADPRHTYAWDAASRLAALDGVTFDYDGFGNPTRRTEGTSITGYSYSFSLPRGALVSERSLPSGMALRHYVHAPDGRLLWMIDAEHGDAVRWFHFDRMGNTLFLTDAEGDVTDSYAYGPYGEGSVHQGASPQPFAFVGEWGVRHETGDVYAMRARWYDARTAAFLSPDPRWPSGDGVRGVNPYQYARQDPLGRSDVTGLGSDTGGSAASRFVSENWDVIESVQGTDFGLPDPPEAANEPPTGSNPGNVTKTLAERILERDAANGESSVGVYFEHPLRDRLSTFETFYHNYAGSSVQTDLVADAWDPKRGYGVYETDQTTHAAIDQLRRDEPETYGGTAEPVTRACRFAVIIGGDADRITVTVRDNVTMTTKAFEQIAVKDVLAAKPNLIPWYDSGNQVYTDSSRNSAIDAFSRHVKQVVQQVVLIQRMEDLQAAISGR